MIIKYKLFIESILSSNSFFKGDDKNIKNLIDRPFQEDCKLINSFRIKEYDKNIILKWYDTPSHSIVYRIKTRTDINSISHFNEITEETITQLLIDHFKELIVRDPITKKDSKNPQVIAVKSPDRPIYFIIEYVPSSIFSIAFFHILSIGSGYDDYTVDKVFELKEKIK